MVTPANSVRVLHLRKALDGSGRGATRHEALIQVCMRQSERAECEDWKTARSYPRQEMPGGLWLGIHDATSPLPARVIDDAGGGHVDPDDD